jgi:transcription antitermination factor NusG
MRPLTDSFFFRPIGKPVLVEAADGSGKVLRRSGVFQNYKIFNQNKRRYGKSLWERHFAPGSPFATRLANRSVVGLLEHPEDGQTKLDRSPSHVITEVHIASDQEIAESQNTAWPLEEGDIVGTLEVLRTRNGKDLQAMIEANIGFGVSSRGSGTVTSVEEGLDVNEDFELETWDVVYNPSVVRATPKQESAGGSFIWFLSRDGWQKHADNAMPEEKAQAIAEELRAKYPGTKYQVLPSTTTPSPLSRLQQINPTVGITECKVGMTVQVLKGAKRGYTGKVTAVDGEDVTIDGKLTVNINELEESLEEAPDLSECEVGNTVDVVSGPHKGTKGKISAASGNTLKVEVIDPDHMGEVKTVTVQHNEVKVVESISIPETVKPPGGGAAAIKNAGTLTESTPTMNPLKMEVMSLVRTPVKGLKPSDLSVIFEAIAALRIKVTKTITEDTTFASEGQRLITRLNEFEDELDAPAAPASVETPAPAAPAAPAAGEDTEVIDASEEIDLLKRAQGLLSADTENEEAVEVAGELGDLIAAIEPELTVTAEESVAVRRVKRQKTILESLHARLAETTANLLERYKAVRDLSTQAPEKLGEGKEESLTEWQNAARDLASRYNRDMIRTTTGLLKVKHPALFESLKDKIAECKTFKQLEALIEKPLTEAVKPAAHAVKLDESGKPVVAKPATVAPKEEETLSEAATSAIAIVARNRKTA